MKKNLGYLDVIKGIACIIVFIEHFTASFCFEARSTYCQKVGMHLSRLFVSGTTIVKLFFVISGFLVVYGYLSSSYKLDIVAKSFYKKVLYLGVPCIVVIVLSWTLQRIGLFLILKHINWGHRIT